jgi:hypothetical protein
LSTISQPACSVTDFAGLRVASRIARVVTSPPASGLRCFGYSIIEAPEVWTPACYFSFSEMSRWGRPVNGNAVSSIQSDSMRTAQVSGRPHIPNCV